MSAFADRLRQKHGGAELRQVDGEDRNRFVVTIRPVKVNAVDLSRPA